MRTTFFIILFLIFDLAKAQCPNTAPAFWIPSAGCSQNLSYYQTVNQTFLITTQGSVDLGSNTFTLTYGSLPSATSTWNVIFHADSLTVETATNVNIFGETPLARFPGQKDFYFQVNCVWNQYGGESKTVQYFASLADLQNVNTTTIFNASIYSNDSTVVKRLRVSPVTPISTGAALIALDTMGNNGYGCPACAWNLLGNSGLNGSTNFIGTLDTASFSIRWNNIAAGIISGNKNNTAFGYGSSVSITGSGECGFGAGTLASTTSGGFNSAFGYGALNLNTTGVYNTALGENALHYNTSGGYNTAIGTQTLSSVTTGSYNVAIGYLADVASASGSYAVAINGTATPNQFTVGSVENIYLPGTNSGVNYVLTDTSGTGNFVPKALGATGGNTYTPVTGDSIVITNPKNTIDPAGTLANLTIILPSNPVPWQNYTFSFLQVISALHFSIRLSGEGNPNPISLPSSETQHSAFTCYWDPNLLQMIIAGH